jgi:hypothetical protein
LRARLVSQELAIAKRRTALISAAEVFGVAAMQEIIIHTASDDAVEIVVPSANKDRLRCSIVCLCCERVDQPMDDDGCGVCDECLDLPVRATDASDALECPAAFPHL